MTLDIKTHFSGDAVVRVTDAVAELTPLAHDGFGDSALVTELLHASDRYNAQYVAPGLLLLSDMEEIRAEIGGHHD